MLLPKSVNNNYPMRITSLNGFSNSLLIKNREENSEDYIFLVNSFLKRDIQHGAPAHFQRLGNSSEGRIINFSLRDICEATGDKYTGHTMANYFKQKAEPNAELTNFIEDLEFSDEFFLKAFVLHLSSGSQGRWDYWQIHIPGLSTEEITALLQKSLLSKSKHSQNPIPAGYSPLLKQGIGKDYHHKLRQTLGYHISEEEYFLSKATAARTSVRNFAEDYYDYLRTQKTNNIDKTYLNFMKKWRKPIILIDNHNETDLPIHLDTLTLEEGYAQTIYPIFHENYPIPDVHKIPIHPQKPKPNNMLSLFESVHALAEMLERGDLGLNSKK